MAKKDKGGFDESKGEAASMGQIYEVLIAAALQIANIEYEHEPEYNSPTLFHRPDFLLKSNGKIFGFISTSHMANLSNSQYKFWEMLGELHEIKSTFGINIISFCAILGHEKGWKPFCFEGFRLIFDHVIYGWEIFENDIVDFAIDFLGKKGTKDFAAQVRMIIQQTKVDTTLSTELNHLSGYIVDCIEQGRKKELDPFWKTEIIASKERKIETAFSLQSIPQTRLNEATINLLKLSDDELLIIQQIINGNIQFETLDKSLGTAKTEVTLKYSLVSLQRRGLINTVRTLRGIEYQITSADLIHTFKGRLAMKAEDIRTLRTFLLSYYPELKKILVDLNYPQEIEQRVVEVLKLTNNFTCDEQRLITLIQDSTDKRKYFKKCSDYYHFIEILCAVTGYKPNRLATNANILSNRDIKEKVFPANVAYGNFIAINGKRQYGPFNNNQAKYFIKTVKSLISGSIEPETIVNWILIRREEQLRRNKMINPLQASIAIQLKKSGIKYKGYPECQYTGLNTLVRELSGGKISGLSGLFGIFFIIPLKNNKIVIIHGKSTNQDGYHESGRLSSRRLFASYTVNKGKIVWNDNIDSSIMILDGDWSGPSTDQLKWVRRFVFGGWNKIFTPQSLSDEWEFIKYLKTKPVIYES